MVRPLDALRDTQREWMINRSRLIASLIGIFALLLILIYRYYSLQITPVSYTHLTLPTICSV